MNELYQFLVDWNRDTYSHGRLVQIALDKGKGLDYRGLVERASCQRSVWRCTLSQRERVAEGRVRGTIFANIVPLIRSANCD